MTSTPAFIFPPSLQGPSSLRLPPNPQHRLPDATNFWNLGLPANTSSILAESQASGRLPGPFNNPAGQPVRTAKTVVAGKRKIVRSNSQQPHMWKAGSASQLPEVSQPQPPPVKARARRVTRAARSSKTTIDLFNQRPPRRPGEKMHRVHHKEHWIQLA